MFWLILSILFVVVVQNVQTTDCTVAQLNELKTCYLTYLKPYGFDVIPTYNKYDSAQDKYRIHGWNGELYICNAGQQLIKCATDKLIDTCVTVDGFKYISGLTYGSSQEYVNDYLQMKYRCLGNGFKEFKDTYTCMNQMHDCPGDPQNCSDFIPYLKCTEDLAFKICGVEGRDYICNTMEILAKVYANCDNLPVCSKNQTEISPFKRLFKQL